ncbi:nucleotide pyrophosphohydrolase [Macrococcus hajekii]|uniref:Nucleotide pyrophosphohydrolase n=1 Tax=Macrococcus hajekii TaxID=198482 RepID=A0A4R6BHI7_9STAP|nr:MazG nucleotide pyrophosphohydrolase domain-containing protein [Macrococcus hajekii]TDM01035.1 nucleotide pyrophosphohydrolase [Macrococcus hajekii]GGB12902.1 nucleotide pyrophosphohydrolase [Macrococcus hajekii]
MNKITVIGLGNYGIDELPYGIYKLLTQNRKVYVRTMKHPVIEALPEVDWHSFDAIYEKHDQFPAVYQEIVDVLSDASENEDILYAVPGHPMVAESTTQLLLERGKDIEIKGGKSFIDDLFTAVKVDPNDGFQMLDATAFDGRQLNIRIGLVVTQVYDQIVASDLKVTLLDYYPAEHPVKVITAARNEGAEVKEIPLFELDHDFEESNLTSLYIPPAEGQGLYGEISELHSVMTILISPEGCPWDQKQTHASLRRYLIEESFEFMEAVDEDDIEHMIEELGDLLLQVVFHAALARRDESFDLREVTQGITDKMVRRHPHVFRDAVVNNLDDLTQVWEQEKKNEGKKKREVKMEKQFADLFMTLYDKVKEGASLEEAVKEVNYET